MVNVHVVVLIVVFMVILVAVISVFLLRKCKWNTNELID